MGFRMQQVEGEAARREDYMTRNELLIVRIDKMLAGYLLQTRWIENPDRPEWHLRGAEKGVSRQHQIKISFDRAALYVMVSGAGDIHDVRVKCRRKALGELELGALEAMVRFLCERASVAKIGETQPTGQVQAVGAEGCA